MKHLLFLLMVFFPLFSKAGQDEVTIFTEDKTCGIHYLSSHPKNNWSIKVPEKACQDGWVNGEAQVELYSPLKEKKEILEGFFNQGYWLDTSLPIEHVIERGSPSEGIQTLSFLLGKDLEAGITYVGQLRAIQPKGRPYGPFQGCPDFRVLVAVPDVSVFQNEAFLDKIVQQGLWYARSHCSSLNVLALFGATSWTNPQIVFQMQVDPTTGERTVVPVTEKKEDDKTVPSELREEPTDVLLSVKPEKEKTIVSYKTERPSPANLPSPPPKEKEALGHLKILSRASKAPLLGRTVVHIHKVLLNGTGITDLPEEVELLYYPGLKTGWAVVEGTLNENKMQVSGVQFCKQEWCTDVP